MDAGRRLTSGKTFVTPGEPETFLIFQQGFPLREFWPFELFNDEEALERFERDFLRPTIDVARRHGYGFVCDLLLWKATPDNLKQLGYPAGRIGEISRVAVEHMRDFITRWHCETGASREDCPVVLGAEIGPRGDAYSGHDSAAVHADSVRDYHAIQIGALREAGAEVLFALTMTGVDETVAMASLAKDHGLSLVVSPTVETDGKLSDGRELGEFIERVDEAAIGYPLFYMVNCAHPTHLEPVLRAAHENKAPWLERFKGLRANASDKSHEELDESTELDAGDSADLATRMADLQKRYGLTLIGGCCGTDAVHIGAMASVCSSRVSGTS